MTEGEYFKLEKSLGKTIHKIINESKDPLTTAGYLISLVLREFPDRIVQLGILENVKGFIIASATIHFANKLERAKKETSSYVG